MPWVAIVGLVAASAHAQTSSEEADGLFRQARRMLSQGRIASACAAFARSQALERALGTLLNHADCLERLGKRAEAHREFLEATHQAQAQQDSRRQALAHARAEALRPRLCELIVEVEPADAVVEVRESLSGELIPPTVGSYLADPGPITVTATAAGRPVIERSVSLAREGEVTRLVLQLAPGALPPPSPAIAAPATDPTAPMTMTMLDQEPPVVTPRRVRPLAVVGVVAGTALAVVSSVSVGWCQNVLDRVARQQPGGLDELSPTVTRATWSTTRWLYPASVAGGLLGVAAVVLGAVFWWSPLDVTVAPTPGGVQLQLSGRLR